MLCERCKLKTSTRKQVMITCKVCGKEEYVSLYNNNCCTICNEKAGVCDECGKKLSDVLMMIQEMK